MTARPLPPERGPACADILVYLRTYSAQHGHPPTIREVGEAVGLSPTSVRAHLGTLQDEGKLRVERRGKRTLLAVEAS